MKRSRIKSQIILRRIKYLKELSQGGTNNINEKEAVPLFEQPLFTIHINPTLNRIYS